jgi:hypothetical protein
MWTRLYYTVSRSSWQAALDMKGAEVAELVCTPTGWKHEPLWLLIRQVRVVADCRLPELGTTR